MLFLNPSDFLRVHQLTFYKFVVHNPENKDSNINFNDVTKKSIKKIDFKGGFVTAYHKKCGIISVLLKKTQCGMLSILMMLIITKYIRFQGNRLYI